VDAPVSHRRRGPGGVPQVACALVLALLVALFPTLTCAAPVALAQSDAAGESELDANKTAKSPDECVEPDPPGDSDMGEVNDYLAAKKAYDECLERTGAGVPEGEKDPTASETSGLDPTGANENAAQPEECVPPESPGDTTADARKWQAKNDAYEDCLNRAGEEAAASDDSAADGERQCEPPGEDAALAEQEAYEDCLASTDQLSDDPQAEPSSPGGTGGILGIISDGFWGIMSDLWDKTFGFALVQMAEAFEGNLLSLPTLTGQTEVIGLYTSLVEKMRPAILVFILALGVLMMVRHSNYDLHYAGFHGLPKALGVAMAMAFLPQFMGELSRITGGITEAFFPGGENLDAAGRELFKAAVGNMVVTNFFNFLLLFGAAWVGTLLVLASLLKSILYVLLFLSGAFVLPASLFPGLQSLTGSWFRGVVACAAIPALWSMQLGVGTVLVRSPETLFGDFATSLGFVSDGLTTSLAALLIMWLMYKTPFKVVEWAFNVQLPGRGGLMSLTKAAATLAVAIPLKTAVAHAVKSSMASGGAAGGVAGPGARGAAAPAVVGAKDVGRSPILKGAGGGIKTAKAHEVKQARDHVRDYEQQRSAQETIQRYLSDHDPGGATQKPRFMSGGPAGDRGPRGRNNSPLSRDPKRA
jgi:hypothetical protein